MSEQAKFKFTFLDEEGERIEDKVTEQEVQEVEEQEEVEQEVEQEEEDSVEETESVEEEYTSEDNEEELDDEEIVDYDELPESVQKYIDFLEETGGSIEDFVRINQDYTKLPQNDVIKQYLKIQNPYLDDADIDYEMERLFSYDEDLDSEQEIREKKVAQKKYYGEAVKALQEQQAKYKVELGSSTISPEAKEALEFKQQYETQQQETSKKVEESRRSFVKQTDKLFGKDFKGFEVQVGDEKILYKPENVSKVKEQNLNVNNLLSKFLDNEGNVKDVAGYHKMMAVASNPEAFAQHFYELGKAAMAEEDARDSKNISMKPRQGQPAPKTDKPKFRFLDEGGSSNKGFIKFKDY
jgi:hypothetical protein